MPHAAVSGSRCDVHEARVKLGRVRFFPEHVRQVKPIEEFAEIVVRNKLSRRSSEPYVFARARSPAVARHVYSCGRLYRFPPLLF